MLDNAVHRFQILVQRLEKMRDGIGADVKAGLHLDIGQGGDDGVHV